MMEYLVITQVPEAGNIGNLATTLGALYIGADPDELNPVEFIHLEEADYLGHRIGAGLAMSMRQRVFFLGEILVTEDGREVAGQGRKPDKWDVSVESFHDIEHAVERAREVLTR